VTVSWSSGLNSWFVACGAGGVGMFALVDKIPLRILVVRSEVDLSQAEGDRLALGPYPASMASVMVW
jgi:hypothetical protein